LTDKARDYLAKVGFDPAFGAKLLKRNTQKLIVQPLANEILKGKFKPDDKIKIGIKKSRLFLYKKKEVRKLKNVTSIMAMLIIGSLIFSCSSDSKSKKTEEELYTEAQNYSENKDFQSAIKTYEEILKAYPDSPRVYKAQFLMGFVYSENLKDYEKARENYRKVIEKYPDCDLADDAKYMLETMEQDSLPTILDTSSASPD